MTYIASYGALPSNLLSLAAQSFESGAGGWRTWANTGTPVQSASGTAFEGNYSLSFTATASGTATVASPANVAPVAGKPHVASCQMLRPAGGQCRLLLAFYDGATAVSTVAGPIVTLPASTSWQPLTIATVAPSGPLTQVVLLVEALSAAASETCGVDFAFIAPSPVQVLVDWLNPAYLTGSIAGNAFTDITPFVNIKSDTISIARGRQDAVSETQTGSCVLKVDNPTGWFTADSSATPWGTNGTNVSIGARLQVNVADESGAWHAVFDGSVTEFDYDVTPGGNMAYATLTANDVLRNLSNQQDLQSWTKQITLNDGPAYHWTLDDAQGALGASESSGNGGPPLLLRTYGSGASMAFQGYTGGGVETMADTGSAPGAQYAATDSSPVAAPQFDTTTAASGTGGFGSASAQLSTQLPSDLLNSAQWSIEAWFMLDGSAYYSPTSGTQFMTLFSLGNTRTGRSLSVALTPNGTSSPYTEDVFVLTAQQPIYAQTLGTSSPSHSSAYAVGPSPTAGVPHHVVLCNNAGTLTLYLDGGTPLIVGTMPSLNTKYGFNWLDIGGLFGGYGGWQGGISLVSIYNEVLTAGQIALHYDMGLDGPYRYMTGSAIQLLASLTGTPSFWLNANLQSGGTPNGLSPIDYVDLTGSNALNAMQEFEACELAGLLYVNAQGQLCFDGRDKRMGAGAPSLTFPAGSFNPNLGYKVTDQYMQTRAAISGTTYDTPAVAIATTQDQKAGQYPNGSAASPTTLPLLMVNPQFDQIGGISGDAIALDPYITDAAQWNVNRNSIPPFKAASVVIDALSLTPGSAEYVALSTLLGVEINTTFTLGGTIASFPNSYGLNYFVEGVNLAIGLETLAFEFYTSPMAIVQAWKPGVGSMDSATAVLGVSAPPSAVPPASKISVVDPGRPFLAPAYGSSMNNTGYVGAADQRGVYDTLAVRQRPPVLIVGQAIAAQSIANQVSNWTIVTMDSVYADVSSGFNRGSNPSVYTVLVPGFYDISYTVQWATSSVSNQTGSARIAMNHVAGNVGGSNANFVARIDRRFTTAVATSMTGSWRGYLGVGTSLALQVWQDTGAAISLHSGTAAEVGLPTIGALLSVRHIGYSLTAD